jgi:hypothetical protein
MFKKTGKIGSIAGAMVALALMATQGFSTTLSLAPASSAILGGSTASVDLVISGIEPDVDVSVFSVKIDFDPSIVELVSYNLYDDLGSLANGDADDATSFSATEGWIRLASTSYLFDLSSQPDNFTLGTLKFKGINLGTSALTIADEYVGDFYGLKIDGITTIDASVTVPEPSATMVFLSGLISLIALGGIRRKGK